jgi:hypothetical protein
MDGKPLNHLEVHLPPEQISARWKGKQRPSGLKASLEGAPQFGIRSETAELS